MGVVVEASAVATCLRALRIVRVEEFDW
jgi:hypothetical protein